MSCLCFVMFNAMFYTLAETKKILRISSELQSFRNIDCCCIYTSSVKKKFTREYLKLFSWHERS